MLWLGTDWFYPSLSRLRHWCWHDCTSASEIFLMDIRYKNHTSSVKPLSTTETKNSTKSCAYYMGQPLWIILFRCSYIPLMGHIYIEFHGVCFNVRMSHSCGISHCADKQYYDRHICTLHITIPIRYTFFQRIWNVTKKLGSQIYDRGWLVHTALIRFWLKK